MKCYASRMWLEEERMGR